MHTYTVVRERKRRQAVESRLRDLEGLVTSLVKHYDSKLISMAKQVRIAIILLVVTIDYLCGDHKTPTQSKMSLSLRLGCLLAWFPTSWSWLISPPQSGPSPTHAHTYTYTTTGFLWEQSLLWLLCSLTCVQCIPLLFIGLCMTLTTLCCIGPLPDQFCACDSTWPLFVGVCTERGTFGGTVCAYTCYHGYCCPQGQGMYGSGFQRAFDVPKNLLLIMWLGRSGCLMILLFVGAARTGLYWVDHECLILLTLALCVPACRLRAFIIRAHTEQLLLNR